MSARCIPAAVVDTDCDRIPVTVWLEQSTAAQLEAMAAQMVAIDPECDEQQSIDAIIERGIDLAANELRAVGIVR
jgi:hypothetical protein